MKPLPNASSPTATPLLLSEWSKSLPSGASILDLGCGHGVPVSQTLIGRGFTIYGVDASPTLIAAFRRRFPNTPAECSSVEDSSFFHRKFDGIVACGLFFLLPPDTQSALIHKVANALGRGGKFLFTAPTQVATWNDLLTGRESVSLGAGRYRQILRGAGFVLVGEASDEGDNHYYVSAKE